MKQILNALVIVALTSGIGCLGIPTSLETHIGYLPFENATEVAPSKNNYDNLINTNKTEMPPLELRKLNNKEEESPVIKIKLLEIAKNEKIQQTNKTMSNDKENLKKEEDHKLKDSPKDVTAEEISKQSEMWKDFEDDFSLLQYRLPDLTEEEFIELNKEDAIPWNFLKSIGFKKEKNEPQPREISPQTPIFITVPIVVNTHSTLPISVNIGGQNVDLKLTDETKDASVSTSNVMDYAKPTPRQTNRHRSNIRSKIYARNNNHQVQEYEYKKDSKFLKRPQ